MAPSAPLVPMVITTPSTVHFEIIKWALITEINWLHACYLNQTLIYLRLIQPLKALFITSVQKVQTNEYFLSTGFREKDSGDDMVIFKQL